MKESLTKREREMFDSLVKSVTEFSAGSVGAEARLVEMVERFVDLEEHVKLLHSKIVVVERAAKRVADALSGGELYRTTDEDLS